MTDCTGVQSELLYRSVIIPGGEDRTTTIMLDVSARGMVLHLAPSRSSFQRR